MDWPAYGSFLAFAVVLVLIPGADFAVVTRNTLVGGRRRGRWSAAGVASSNAVQGSAAAAGLGAVIVHVEPLFLAIRWLGIAYLVFLGAQAFRSAIRGDYAAVPQDDARDAGRQRRRGFRQGFLSNITNPKVLVFYLAVLPQFLGPHTATAVLAVFALSHATLSLTWLQLIVATMDRARRLLVRRRVRRAMDAVTGSALVGFGARLAVEH